MTYADELRALADKADALVQQNADRRECSVYLDMAMESIEGLAPVLRALADKLQGKVAVKPEVLKVRRPQKVDGRWTIGPQVGWTAMLVVNDCEEAGDGYTEAEAIANLQVVLDAAERGEG